MSTEALWWVGSFIACAVTALLLWFVVGSIAWFIRKPVIWVLNYIAYGFWRSGLYLCARTHKLIIAGILFIPLGLGVIGIAALLFTTEFSPDFQATAIALGSFVGLLGLWLICAAFKLIGAYFEDNPYAAAQQNAAAIFAHMNRPIFGSGGRATLDDLEQAGHYTEDQEP